MEPGRELEKKRTADRNAILNAAEIRLLNRELQRVLVSSLPGLPANILDRSDETIRRAGAVGELPHDLAANEF